MFFIYSDLKFCKAIKKKNKENKSLKLKLKCEKQNSIHLLNSIQT